MAITTTANTGARYSLTTLFFVSTDQATLAETSVTGRTSTDSVTLSQSAIAVATTFVASTDTITLTDFAASGLPPVLTGALFGVVTGWPRSMTGVA
jgi:hypothetical protein